MARKRMAAMAAARSAAVLKLALWHMNSLGLPFSSIALRAVCALLCASAAKTARQEVASMRAGRAKSTSAAGAASMRTACKARVSRPLLGSKAPD